MRGAIACMALSGLTTLSAAVPLQARSFDNNVVNEFKSIDNFPTPSAQEILNIEQRAHGTLSNSSAPATIDPDTVISLQVIAAQEQMEAGFFQQLLTNVTEQGPGFGFRIGAAQQFAIEALTAIVAVSSILPRKGTDVLISLIARGAPRSQRN